MTCFFQLVTACFSASTSNCRGLPRRWDTRTRARDPRFRIDTRSNSRHRIGVGRYRESHRTKHHGARPATPRCRRPIPRPHRGGCDVFGGRGLRRDGRGCDVPRLLRARRRSPRERRRPRRIPRPRRDPGRDARRPPGRRRPSRRRLRHDEVGGGFRPTPRASGGARALRRARHPPRRRPGRRPGPPRIPPRVLLLGRARHRRGEDVPAARSRLRPRRLGQRHARLILRPLQRHGDQRGVPRPRRLPRGIRLDPRILLPLRQARRRRGDQRHAGRHGHRRSPLSGLRS